MSQTEQTTDTPVVQADPAARNHLGPPRLSLTDFLDLDSLQEVQDSFMVLTRLRTSIRDADGQHVTSPTDTVHRAQSDAWLDYLISPDTDCDKPLTAPIVVEGQQLGSILVEPCGDRSEPSAEARKQFRAAVKRLGVAPDQVEKLLAAAEAALVPSRAASIQFLYLLANNIARLCYQEYHARQRVEELSALYQVSTLLSGQRDLQRVLDTAARSVAEVMNVKAVSIRLISEQQDRSLLPRAVHNLSDEYLGKGPIHIDRSELFREALKGKTVYVADMQTDPRVLFPDDAQREGLVSMLCAGMTYRGKPIGCIQLFTGEPRTFSRFQANLVQAMTHLLATAIENARLDQERMDNQRVLRQLHLAADVQRRMLPRKMPSHSQLDIAARYVPSFELGGDFYDFINLDGHLGVVVGDVVGKGIAASLLMASVRASLRAYAQDLYDLDQIIVRVNSALSRDTRDNEFATLWYGVFDPQTMRLTYCNAGHDPPLLLRDGTIHYLSTGGMAVGIDQTQQYDKDIWTLQPGDVVLLYTDGLVDSFNFDEQRFGRKRIETGLRQASEGSAADVLNHVLWSMRRFTGLRRGFDDTTLVVIKVNPSVPD